MDCHYVLCHCAQFKNTMNSYSPECHYVVSRGATNLQDFHALEVDLGVGMNDRTSKTLGEWDNQVTML